MKLKKFYDKYFPYIFIFIFLALSILLITHHEFWRDEVHAWDIAKNSSSLSQFVYYMRQSEGTPYLWNFILFLISHFISDNIEVMKVLHLTISTISSFLFLKFAPFNKLTKVLFIFGYFSFFEYSIISRNYALGILLIFIFCILYKNRYKNILLISITLFFMGACNMYSFFISISFMLLLLIDFIIHRKNEFRTIKKVSLIISIMVALSEMILIYWQIGGQFINNFVQNTSPNSFLQNYVINLKPVPAILLNAYIPIPNLNINFWNTNLLLNTLSGVNILVVVSIIFIFLVVSVLLLGNRIKVIFLFGIVVMINFMILVYSGSIRHWGHIFILFFACLWLSKNEEEQPSFYSLKPIKLMFNIFISIILLCSLVGSTTAFYYDYNYPFSNGKNVSEYLKKSFNINNLVIVGYKNYTTETIAGYLNKDFYYPEEHKFSKIFNMITRKQVDPNVILSDAIELKLQNLDKDILIINDKQSALSENFLNDNDFKIIKDFSNAIVSDENYTLFLLNNDLNFETINNINASNFKASFINFNNCEAQIINKDQVLIKSSTDDPNFESNFQVPKISVNDELYIKIDMEVTSGSNLAIYYKRANSQFSENDLSVKELKSGSNTIVIKVENLIGLEGIRIDPVNINENCILNNIELYTISKK